MSAYLLLPTEENCLKAYIHKNFTPEELGSLLMKFFNTTEKCKPLFGRTLQRIHHIENKKIIPMTTQEIIDSRLGICLYPQIDTRDLSEILSGYGCYEVQFTYVFQDEIWICYAIYSHNNKRIMEEIHLYNDYFKNIIKQRKSRSKEWELLSHTGAETVETDNTPNSHYLAKKEKDYKYYRN